MLKEIFALLLIILLMSVSAWNIKTVDSLCTEITQRLEQAKNLAMSGSTEMAQAELRSALKKWLDAESYTHIFIRHPEIDSCSDAFYDALSALGSGEAMEIIPCFEKLRYHLESIASMERISLGNIF